MQALAIVPSFDVLKDRRASLRPGDKRLGSTFRLERGEEAFHHGVVVAIPDSAHALLTAIGSQALAIERTGVLAALIGVVQQALRGSAAKHSHLQSVLDQRCVHAIGHGPAHNVAGIQVQHRRQIQPAFHRGDVGYIRRPLPVGSGSGKLLVQAIGSRGYLFVPLRGVRRSPLGYSPDQPVQAHQAGHSFPAAERARSTQGRMNAGRAIGLSTGLVHLPDLPQQRLVGLCPRTDLASLPSVIAAAAHVKDLTHAPDPMLLLMGGHEFVFHVLFREKMFTAFFRISRSSCRSASSRCRRRISTLADSMSLGSR